jgi:hypothetical protein
MPGAPGPVADEREVLPAFPALQRASAVATVDDLDRLVAAGADA